jgi:septum formation protein
MIVLASRSASRQAMLRAAGIAFEARPAAINERAMEESMTSAAPEAVALALARAKALAIAENDLPVLGSDSLVVAAGRRFDKPASREEAAQHLRLFSGEQMQLHSAAAIIRQGEVVWEHAALARLQVRELSEGFIQSYLDREWPAVSQCVGVFRIEGPGVQLFESIEGDHFTVLGMPLLAVMAALRDLGELGR